MRICCQFSLEVHVFCGLLACRKTALMLALCEALRDKYSIAAVSALFLPYTPKYNLCSPRPSHHHEQLERNKRSRQDELGHVKLCCNCDSYIIKNSTLKKFEKMIML